MSVTVLAKNTCTTTGEGPFWDETTNSLLYVDILAGDVHCWSTISGEDTKVHLGIVYRNIDVSTLYFNFI